MGRGGLALAMLAEGLQIDGMAESEYFDENDIYWSKSVQKCKSLVMLFVGQFRSGPVALWTDCPLAGSAGL